MTMADTVAVMNNGVIEQLGRPMDLYEHPSTTFVANFLGQSNLIRGSVERVEGDLVAVQVSDGVLRAPAPEGGASGDTWVGVRPEKVFLSATGTESHDGSNVLRGGTVSDVSFIGVSTQYLVRMPWEQELTIFEQNTGARERFATGDSVDLHWMPEHSFLLDADQDASAGSQLEDDG